MSHPSVYVYIDIVLHLICISVDLKLEKKFAKIMNSNQQPKKDQIGHDLVN